MRHKTKNTVRHGPINSFALVMGSTPHLSLTKAHGSTLVEHEFELTEDQMQRLSNLLGRLFPPHPQCTPAPARKPKPNNAKNLLWTAASRLRKRFIRRFHQHYDFYPKTHDILINMEAKGPERLAHWQKTLLSPRHKIPVKNSYPTLSHWNKPKHILHPDQPPNYGKPTPNQ